MQPNGQIRFVVHPLLAERVENACDLGTVSFVFSFLKDAK